MVFVEFSLKPAYPPLFEKTFKLMVLRLLENAFESQKIESGHFIHAPLAEENYSLPPTRQCFSENLCHPAESSGDKTMDNFSFFLRFLSILANISFNTSMIS